ncbi:MAG: DUF4367 domain-containing protein [Eubacteriales bacterium]
MNHSDNTPLSVEGLKQQLEDTRLRLALLEAQGQEDEAMQAAWDALPPDAPEKREEARFFARTEKGTLRLIRKHERRAARAERPRRIPRPLTVAAAAVLILCLSLGTALAVNPALRVQIMRLLYNVTPEYTEVRFVPDEAASFDVPAEWTGLYYPAFIPEGYELDGIGGSRRMPIAVYTAANDQYLTFTEHDLESEVNINSEGYFVEEVQINNMAGILSYRDKKTIITWANTEKAFTLSITEDRDIALAVAQSVIPIK